MNITAVLLAGGESRRMGKDKTTILFRGKPLWKVQLELLWKLQPSEIFISARTAPSWRPDNVQFVEDASPSRGPLSGLAASLAKMCTGHLLALAIDMPLMTENFLRHLCKQIEPGCGIVPTIADRAEPLAAIYPRQAEIGFRDALVGSDFSLQSLVRSLIEAGNLREMAVAEQEQRLFFSVNAPSDLMALL